MKTLESRLKDLVKADLKRLGVYTFMPVQTGYGSPSLDMLCCIPADIYTTLQPQTKIRTGRFVAIETKAPGKKPTPRQDATMTAIRAAGGVAFWCTSFAEYQAQMVMYGLVPRPNGGWDG